MNGMFGLPPIPPRIRAAVDADEIDRLQRIEDKYTNLCAVLNEQTQTIKDLNEQVAFLQSREVCAAAHDDVETCGYCQRDALKAEIWRLRQELANAPRPLLMGGEVHTIKFDESISDA